MKTSKGQNVKWKDLELCKIFQTSKPNNAYHQEANKVYEAFDDNNSKPMLSPRCKYVLSSGTDIPGFIEN